MVTKKETPMKTIVTVLFALTTISAFAQGPVAAGTYTVDPMHSKVGFEVPHLVISSVEGRFNDFKGEIRIGEKFADSSAKIEIEAKSVDTAIAKRDDHLRSGDFFDAKKFPKLTFQSKRFEGSPESFKLVGDLTIKGKTKEVTLNGKYLGTVKDGYGNQKAAFQADTKINRRDFGLTWNSAVEAGPVVGDEVSISLKIQAAKNK
jgi:polyisoprenoid-binding protein YceI